MSVDTEPDVTRLSGTFSDFVKAILAKQQLADAASVQSATTDEGDTILRVQPKRPRAAPMSFNVRDGSQVIYGWFGANTPFELTLEGGRYTELKGSSELSAIIQAVVQGLFHETLWRQGKRVVRSSSVLTINGKDIHIHNSTIWRNPFVRGEKEELQYSRY